MAKREKKDKSKPKEIGKLRQLWRVFKMTAKVDKSAPWVALLAFVLPVLAGVGLGIIFDARNALVIFVWTLLGVMVGLLAGLAVMSRRAERAAYSQIQGQAGAVGAVLSSSLKRGWRTSEMPVAISPRSRDAVYRTVGPAGIVLIAEGSRAKGQQMMEDERRKLQRAAPGVTIHTLYATNDEGSIPLHRLTIEIKKLKRTLNRSEITVVNNRLQALGQALPIPKGIDPLRARPIRK